MYSSKDINSIILPIVTQLRTEKTPTFKIVLTSFMGLLAAIIQSSGGFIPVIGVLISPLATIPIIIVMLIGGVNGLMGYILTIFLLLFIQPSELIIFPFTTGLVGIGIGLSLVHFKKRWLIFCFSGLLLSVGICTLLYGFQFPILGPFLLEFHLGNIIIIYCFTVLYSWGLTELLLIKILPIIFNRLNY